MNIKVITAPTVRLIGSQRIEPDGMADFLADHGVPGWESSTSAPGQVLAETGGRLCYMSFAKPRPGGNAGYLRHILETGHGSVLEHAVYTLILTGISRSCSHEIVRHRVGLSPSQLSQRYVDESDVAFVIPPALLPAYLPPRDDYDDYINPAASVPLKGALVEFVLSCDLALRGYRAMTRDLMGERAGFSMDETVRRKQAREASRSVLPNAAETRMQLTGNARAWRHLLELRGSPGADAEIRRLALAILPVLDFAAPNLFGDYTVVTSGGVEHLTTPYPGV